ncbi:tetratricopeptide repeat protein [Hymenobacter weizhouensis]|uniref:tetratricopeptide repeat protein n=1 Tax=Hymenobacter sp. YIM 151500-1 TaxID=2987689 RepID=UPI0022264165|nr:tetratricopeptide repeat protein [Hymenobacter sp. YIM 151500-1]UYZ61482.1 hypothetical protein OIS53_10725 [Hymenobacter sp. YIM 151500-1]
MKPVRANPDQWQEAAHHLLNVHRPAQAEQVARQRLAAHPQDAQAYQLLTLALLNQAGRAAEALPVVRQALALDPQHSDAYYFHAVALLHTEQPHAALRAIAEARHLAPIDATYSGYEAVVLHALRQPAAALQAATEGLQHDPSHLECLFQRVRALQRLGRRPEAALTIQQLAYWHPDQAITHYLLGKEAERQQQPEAEAHFREAMRLKPGYEPPRAALRDLLADRAELALLRRKYAQAEAAFREVLVLDPAYHKAERGLCQAQLQQHWTQRPVAWFYRLRSAWAHQWPAGSLLHRAGLVLRVFGVLALLVLALLFRGPLHLRHYLQGENPIARDTWFYAGLGWGVTVVGAAALFQLPVPLVWLAVVGGLVFPLRTSWLKWRAGQGRWPAGAQLMLSPGAVALINAHSNFLTPNAAIESRYFLASFGALLILYQLFRPTRQQRPTSSS